MIGMFKVNPWDKVIVRRGENKGIIGEVHKVTRYEGIERAIIEVNDELIIENSKNLKKVRH